MRVPMSRNPRQTIYFALAVAVLAASAIATEYYNFKIIKSGLPIRKPLVDMPVSVLGHYELLASRRLSSDILSELGTDEYIEWTLRDKRIADKNDALVNLFITYYTNVQDQVPHVPEECNPQAGLVPSGDDTIDIRIDSLDEDISVRRLGFLPKKEIRVKNIVYYTINVNGAFHSGRQGARLEMADPLDTHLYYSKIEIMFSGRTRNDDPELDRRAAELMNMTIDALFKDYWPPRGTERGGYKSATSASTDSIANPSDN